MWWCQLQFLYSRSNLILFLFSGKHPVLADRREWPICFSQSRTDKYRNGCENPQFIMLLRCFSGQLDVLTFLNITMQRRKLKIFLAQGPIIQLFLFLLEKLRSKHHRHREPSATLLCIYSLLCQGHRLPDQRLGGPPPQLCLCPAAQLCKHRPPNAHP